MTVTFCEQRTALPDSMFSRQQNGHWKLLPRKPKKEVSRRKKGHIQNRGHSSGKAKRQSLETRSQSHSELVAFKQLEAASKVLLLLERGWSLKVSSASRAWKDLIDRAQSNDEALEVRDLLEEKRRELMASPDKRRALLKRFKWLGRVGKFFQRKTPKQTETFWSPKEEMMKKAEERKAVKALKEAKADGNGKSIDDLLKEPVKTAQSKTEAKIEAKKPAAPAPKNGGLQRVKGLVSMQKLADPEHSRLIFEPMNGRAATGVSDKYTDAPFKFGSYAFVHKGKTFSIRIEKVA